MVVVQAPPPCGVVPPLVDVVHVVDILVDPGVALFFVVVLVVVVVHTSCCCKSVHNHHHLGVVVGNSNEKKKNETKRRLLYASWEPCKWILAATTTSQSETNGKDSSLSAWQYRSKSGGGCHRRSCLMENVEVSKTACLLYFDAKQKRISYLSRVVVAECHVYSTHRDEEESSWSSQNQNTDFVTSNLIGVDKWFLAQYKCDRQQAEIMTDLTFLSAISTTKTNEKRGGMNDRRLSRRFGTNRTT